MTSHIMPTYNRLPITFERGEGAWLLDEDNNRYLDAISGIAVCNLGHAHPAVHKAICTQSEKLLHTSNIYKIANQERLADKLTEKSGMDNVFFCNSGAEANEAAIKLARKYGHEKGIENPAIIVMDKSFHGRTLATQARPETVRYNKVLHHWLKASCGFPITISVQSNKRWHTIKILLPCWLNPYREKVASISPLLITLTIYAACVTSMNC